MRKFEWLDQDTILVQNIFKEINQNILLSYPDFSQKFQLYSDASDVGIGSILKQGESVIGFYSKKLNPPERNYSVMEKEAFAI